MVIGALVSLHEAQPSPDSAPLAGRWPRGLPARGSVSAHRFSPRYASRRLNTALTAIYLGVVLPLLGVHLPLAKTLIVFTFLTGLLPVAGNLISNTVIVIVSLADSVGAAFGSLIFLVVIHKLEYFLNARIVGGEIQARAWSCCWRC